MRKKLFIIALGSTAFWMPPIASADLTRVQLSDVTKPVELRVEIRWGSLRIRGRAEAAEITVEARGDEPNEVAGIPLEISEKDNRVIVEQISSPRGVFRSAHLEIEVPLRSDLELWVHRGGDIWVDELFGQVEVTNLNGSVELARIRGVAAVNASNGSIRAGFIEVDPDLDMIFTSLNGSIELCLPETFAARVHLSTAGDVIRSDFEIASDREGRLLLPGARHRGESAEVRGKIGGGQALLRASTLNGEIALRRCGQ